jgi:ArsR family transcriptional regulator, arsenate/arsenite/antimonite-responsive transcriptional repressor
MHKVDRCFVLFYRGWLKPPVLMTSFRNRSGANLKFRALADPTRLRILHLLHANALCVGELIEIIGVPQPTASRHLAYLRRAQLVITRKEGLWIYYSLAPAGNKFHRKLLECLEECPDLVPELKADEVRAAKLQKARRPLAA